jgi:hypothetical protein
LPTGLYILNIKAHNPVFETILIQR